MRNNPYFGSPSLWQVGWHRFFEITLYIIGFETDNFSKIVFACLLLAFLLFKKQRKTEIRAYAPFAIVLLICLLAPFRLSYGAYAFANE